MTLPSPAASAASADRAERLAALRAQLARVAPPPAARAVLASGLPALDQACGGWARPGLNEVVGLPGSGRLGLVLPTMRALADQGYTIAVVDPLAWLHPPGLAGLPLHRLLLVRPGTRALWAAEQLARCGALPLVVLLDPGPLGRGARRLQQAAEAGNCALLMLNERPEAQLRPALRLQAVGHRLFELQRGGPPQPTRVRV